MCNLRNVGDFGFVLLSSFFGEEATKFEKSSSNTTLEEIRHLLLCTKSRISLTTLITLNIQTPSFYLFYTTTTVVYVFIRVCVQWVEVGTYTHERKLKNRLPLSAHDRSVVNYRHQVALEFHFFFSVEKSNG